MNAVLAVLAAFWFLAAVTFAALFLRQRSVRKQRNVFGEWPIARVMPEMVDPVFRAGPFGPTLDTEVAFVGRGPFMVHGGTSDAEGWVLATLARGAKLMFEIGTCTGKTTYLWARNSPPDARVVTLTLAPSDVATYTRDAADDARSTAEALTESTHTDFLYSQSQVEHKVEQLYGDSKTFDFSPWKGRCDLIFVDGSHAYSYVVSDSEKALQLVAPGGLVLWHDYAGPRHASGVYRALNELSRRIPLVRIEGTMLVAYRRPVAGPA